MSGNPFGYSEIDNLVQYPANRKYPHTFFDPLTFSVPTIKIAMMWSRRFYRIDPLIQGTIRKMATYPITNLVVSSRNERIKTAVEKIIRHLKIRKFLMCAGLDYFCYGNCFVSVSTPIKRHIICTQCGEEDDILAQEKIAWKQEQIMARCKKCDYVTEHKVKDIQIGGFHDVQLIRWCPEYIEIKHNPISGNYQYVYAFPQRVKKDLLSNDPFYAHDTPIPFIKAVQKDQRIILNRNKLFHLKRESLGDDLAFWGEPMAFPLLRELYYFYVNKKAQEILAHERIVPLRVIYPTNPGGISPDISINLGNWRSKVEEALKRWTRDPNYIPIMPFPVGYQAIGGEATRITLWPELNASQSRILLGLGVPPEFLVSGTWTGSSISVRMVENLLLNYRNEQEELLEFLLSQILPLVDIDPEMVTVTLSNFKMADDIQFKQLMFQLNQQEKISDQTLMAEMGINYEEEIEKLKKDMEKRAELAIENARISGEAAARQMKEQVKGQVGSQIVAQKMQEGASLEGSEQMYLPDIVKSIILQLRLAPPEIQRQTLTQMQKTMPTLYEIVTQFIGQPQPVQEEQEQVEVAPPNPEVQPPRRKDKTI